MSTPSFSGTREAGTIVTGKCELVTFPPTTAGTITIPTPDVRCICGDSMAGLFTHTGPQAGLVECATGTKGAPIETAGPTERASLNKHTTANGTTYQAATTKFFTEGCILSTHSAGPSNGVAFPTPKVKCLCGANGSIMCGVNTLVANGTSFIACATEQPVFTSLQTPSPLPTATTSDSQTINASQYSTCSGVRVFEMAKEPFNTTDSANRAGGSSPSDAQSSGVKPNLGLGGMLATILVLAGAFSMV